MHVFYTVNWRYPNETAQQAKRELRSTNYNICIVVDPNTSAENILAEVKTAHKKKFESCHSNIIEVDFYVTSAEYIIPVVLDIFKRTVNF